MREIDKSEILKNEEVGHSKDGTSIFHILLKGGLSILALKKRDGSLQTLSTGSLFKLAKVSADNLMSDIRWHDFLYKSADGDITMLHQFNEFAKNLSPLDFYKSGSYHAKQAGRIESNRSESVAKAEDGKKLETNFSDVVSILSHANTSKRHFEYSGLSKEAAAKEFVKYLSQHSDLKKNEAPTYSVQDLDTAFELRKGDA